MLHFNYCSWKDSVKPRLVYSWLVWFPYCQRITFQNLFVSTRAGVVHVLRPYKSLRILSWCRSFGINELFGSGLGSITFESNRLNYNDFAPKMLRLFEPKHDKTSKMICAPSEDSDQPGHPSSLTRVFAVRSVGKGPRFLHDADSDDSDYLSIHWVHRSFCCICHAATHSSFKMEINVQVNCKVCPQYISYCKIPIFLTICVTFCRIKGLCVLQYR